MTKKNIIINKWKGSDVFHCIAIEIRKITWKPLAVAILHGIFLFSIGKSKRWATIFVSLDFEEQTFCVLNVHYTVTLARELYSNERLRVYTTETRTEEFLKNLTVFLTNFSIQNNTPCCAMDCLGPASTPLPSSAQCLFPGKKLFTRKIRSSHKIN